MEINAEEKEISLLDLLVVVAENFKLLIFGPIVVGLLVLGIGYTLPHSFTSQAILALPTPTKAAAMMVSPLVLDPSIRSLNLSEGLANQIRTSEGKDGFLRLNVTANTPLEAQTLANAVIDTWLKSTAPSGQDRADLEKRLAYAKTSLKSVSRLLDRITSEGTTYFEEPLTRGEAGTTIVAVGELQALYLTQVLDISRSLQGLSRDVVAQPPSLPAEPDAPKKSLVAVLAALGSGFALLLWVFVRQAWKTAALDPETAEKHAKLYAAMRFKSRTS